MSQEWIALIASLSGVVVGFLLSVGYQAITARLEIRRLKKALRGELRSIKFQVGQKEDVLRKMIAELGNGNILPGETVPIPDDVYSSGIYKLLPHLTAKQRNCLHVIYGHLRVADRRTADFEIAVRRDLRDARLQYIEAAPQKDEVTLVGLGPTEVLRHHKGQLGDLLENYGTVVGLIESYLKDDPIDVFYTEKGGFEASKTEPEDRMKEGA